MSHPESTHTRIVRSAARCFGRYGYRKTSVDDVARDAGVAKGTVYLYCDDKRDLLRQAVRSDVEQWLTQMSAFVDDRPADEILFDIARRDAEFVASRPLVRDLWSGALVPHLDDAEDLEPLRRLGLTQVVRVLELGVAQGVFADDLDVGSTARVLQEMHLRGVLLDAGRGSSAREVRRQQAAAMRLALDGLRTRRPGR